MGRQDCCLRRVIKELLEKYSKVTGQRIYEELTAAGYAGGINIQRDHLR
ncbi:MAG: hypothetical protein AB7U29_11885 [Desulfobulbus sp.]